MELTDREKERIDADILDWLHTTRIPLDGRWHRDLINVVNGLVEDAKSGKLVPPEKPDDGYIGWGAGEKPQNSEVMAAVADVRRILRDEADGDEPFTITTKSRLGQVVLWAKTRLELSKHHIGAKIHGSEIELTVTNREAFEANEAARV